MEWTGRQVLVTGAGGFIGSHLSERLLELGARVRAMVHGDSQHRAGFLGPLEVDGLEVVAGDLRDAAFVRTAAAGCNTVFHLGAVTSVAYSYGQPGETVATNALGTLNVCAAAHEHGVQRFVHTSTAGVYGNARDDAPITEDHPVMGCNPYTAGKLAGDHVAQTWHLSYGLPVTTIRLFNVYGPRMGRYLIMPTIIEQLLAGPELRLGDLSPTRTFTHVDDIVDAYIRMAETEAAVGEVVHFGSEEVLRMGELVERIAALMDRPYHITEDPARLRPKKSEIFRVRVDCAKARKLLGWKARVGLDEGLRKTVDWIAGGGYSPS